MKKKILIILFLVLGVTLFGCKGVSTTIVETTSTTTLSTPSSTTSSGKTSTVTTTAPTTTSSTTFLIVNTLEYSYDKVLDSDLEIDLSSQSATIAELQTESGTPFSSEWVTYTEGKALINSRYLEGLPLETNRFLIETSAGLFELRITISDTRKPEIIGSLSVNYQMDVDLVFEYEAYAGSFQMISGNDITSDDYTFDGYTFTINFDYIHGKFTENPERNALILQVFFNYPEGVVFSYIFIYKPE